MRRPVRRERDVPGDDSRHADEKQTNLKKYEEYFLRYQLTDRMVKSAAKPDENFASPSLSGTAPNT